MIKGITHVTLYRPKRVTFGAPTFGSIKGIPQDTPTLEDSNVEESSTSPQRWVGVALPQAPPIAGERRVSNSETTQSSDAAARACSAEPRARPPLDREQEPTDALLSDIAAAQFDAWNNCPFPGLPPIHSASASKHQTADEVCAAWLAAIDEATAIIGGDRKVAIQLFKGCLETKARQILDRARTATDPLAYVRKALANTMATRRRKSAARARAMKMPDFNWTISEAVKIGGAPYRRNGKGKWERILDKPAEPEQESLEATYRDHVRWLSTTLEDSGGPPSSLVRELINKIGPKRAGAIITKAEAAGDTAACIQTALNKARR